MCFETEKMGPRITTNKTCIVRRKYRRYRPYFVQYADVLTFVAALIASARDAFAATGGKMLLQLELFSVALEVIALSDCKVKKHGERGKERVRLSPT